MNEKNLKRKKKSNWNQKRKNTDKIELGEDWNRERKKRLHNQFIPERKKVDGVFLLLFSFGGWMVNANVDDDDDDENSMGKKLITLKWILGIVFNLR